MSIQLLTTPCIDVKVGGSISGSTITGGTSLVAENLLIADYSGLWGVPGGRGLLSDIVGQPGSALAGQNLPRHRLLTLSVRATDTPGGGGVPTHQQLSDNQDTLAGLFDDPAGTLIEWVTPDGSSRWIIAHALQSAPIVIQTRYRLLSLPLDAPWPYWRAETLDSQVINGAAVAYTNLGGTVKRVYDPILEFAGDGVFTDNSSGLTCTVAGSAGTVTVQRDATTGRWTATEGGSPVPNKVTFADPRGVYLTKGGTATTTVSVTVKTRDQWV